MKNSDKFQGVVDFVKSQYPNKDFIALHEPVFIGNERKYVMDAIDSTFVSSVGAYVNRFEEMMAEITGAKYAIAIVNGTNALHMALILAGVDQQDEVLSQALTFIATANAVSYIGAKLVFIDVDKDTLGMSATALKKFLEANAEKRKNGTYNKTSGKKITAKGAMALAKNTSITHLNLYGNTVGDSAAIALSQNIQHVCQSIELRVIKRKYWHDRSRHMR